MEPTDSAPGVPMTLDAHKWHKPVFRHVLFLLWRTVYDHSRQPGFRSNLKSMDIVQRAIQKEYTPLPQIGMELHVMAAIYMAAEQPPELPCSSKV